MLTRSTVRDLLNRITIDSLSEDILLEIFDAHRKLYELQPHYENFWNSRDGWFKLTHVCQSWRRVVHSSPSRLDMHLLFTPNRSSRVLMLKSIPPFPILVDYSLADWTEREQGLALAAIAGKNRSRVHGISLRRRRNTHMEKLLRALSHPFPELESLIIGSSCDRDYELILPAAFLSGSAPCLRRLTLRDVVPICLPPLLSFATDLVELFLTLRVSRNALPEASLIASLQRLSCLRRLELRVMYSHASTHDLLPWPPTEPRDIVPLPNLMQFVFSGQRHYLEALVFELAAPQMQYLTADIGDTSYTFPIPYLCRFICDTNIQFTFVRLDFASFQVRFTAETRSKSVHASASAQSFNIIFPEHTPLEEMGSRLSGPLTTVEELVVEWGMTGGARHIQWRRFFDHLRQVKLIQVPSQVAIDVALAFRPDGQALAMDVLPALEQVKVQMVHIPPLSDNAMNPYITIPNAFDPLIAARRRVGFPITLSLT